MSIRLAVVILLVFACGGSAVATWKVSSDPGFDTIETALSGVRMSWDSDWMERVTAKLGKPTKISDMPGTEFESGRHRYEWDNENLRLGVVTLATGAIETVEVWGPKPIDEVGTTGHGLKLGATLADVHRIYGSRSGYGSCPSNNMFGQWITIQWETSAFEIPARQTTTLDISLNATGNVNHMKLQNKLHSPEI